MTQLFDDARECSAFDVVCNVSGTVLGVVTQNQKTEPRIC
jgi:hypothetical protein